MEKTFKVVEVPDEKKVNLGTFYLTGENFHNNWLVNQSKPIKSYMSEQLKQNEQRLS